MAAISRRASSPRVLAVVLVVVLGLTYLLPPTSATAASEQSAQAQSAQPLTEQRALTPVNLRRTLPAGGTRTVKFSSVAGLAAGVAQSVQAQVTTRSARKGTLRIRPHSASGPTTTVRFRARSTTTSTVLVPVGSTNTWALRNSGKRQLKVTIRVTDFVPANNGSPAPDDQAPGDQTPGDSGGPGSPGEPGAPGGSGPISSEGRFDMAPFSGTDIWVDPVSGSDSRSGTSRETALRTITAAWGRIPASQTLSTGYRMQLVAGTYTSGQMPHWWENRTGTYHHPVVFNSVDGAGAAILQGDINMFASSYIYFIGINIQRNGDAFHCEQCSYIVIRDSTLNGDTTAGGDVAHETIKVNQSDHFYIEDSTISGAEDNTIDFVAVQYGHIKGNRISDAGDWCAYAKGGSAYLTVAENEIFDCGTGGFTAGQGTGVEFMTSPWIHYEAMDIKVVNNVIHDTQGAGLGVNGGYNILLAYNTIYRVGTRSHTIEFVFGLRSCDGWASTPEACTQRLNAGGWGTATTGEAYIPNKHVYFYNNVILNTPDHQSPDQHFAIYDPRTQPSGFSAPDPATTDTDLRIVGNVIWNGSAEKPLGIEDNSSACNNANPTCNAAQLRGDNIINTTQPDFIDPAGGDFTPAQSGWLESLTAAAIPDFNWTDRPDSDIPVGSTSNSVSTNRAGEPREGWARPGAY